METVGVLVVDDHPVFRSAAREVIEATPSFVALGEARSGESALAAVAELEPDLVLLDVRMAGIDAIAVAEEISAAASGCVVVLISIAGAPEISGDLGARAAALVRKQDLCPALLGDLWRTYGTSRAAAG